MSASVTIVHDQLIQRGGAERVVLAMAEAFPAATVVTSVYDPDRTFPEFADLEVRPLLEDRFGLFDDDFRRALPLLAVLFTRARLDSDVVLCSSAGWAHGVRSSGRKIVYCHTPPRWLYNFTHLRGDIDGLDRRLAHTVAPLFRRWDRWAARSADDYLVNSVNVQQRVRSVYGIDSTVLAPPTRIDPDGPTRPLPGIEPGFVLTVTRLQSYKNVTVVFDAARRLPRERFVVAGTGPLFEALSRQCPENVTLVGGVDDGTIRWLYSQCDLLVAPAFEDFGLTPLEAAAFGRPSVALAWGGHVETVRDGRTGVLFDRPAGDDVVDAIGRARRHRWHAPTIRDHARSYSTERFVQRLRSVVDPSGPRPVRTTRGDAPCPPSC